MGGLRERPLTENRGLSERPLTGKQGILELKITKKRIFFLKKTRVFSIGLGRKSGTKNCKSLKRGSFGAAQVEKWGEGGFRGAHTRTVRAPTAQRQMRQMRKKKSFGPTFFHLAQTFGAYFFRRHFYFFLCYKRYELRKRLMTPNKQCRWRVFLNWW